MKDHKKKTLIRISNRIGSLIDRRKCHSSTCILKTDGESGISMPCNCAEDLRATVAQLDKELASVGV